MKDLMHYKGYYGSVHFDQDNLIFHGKIEFIRALVNYESCDAVGLKKFFQEAVDDYLVACKEQGIEPEKPFKGSLNVRFGSDLHRRIAIVASHHDISINKYIANVVGQAVRQDQQSNHT